MSPKTAPHPHLSLRTAPPRLARRGPGAAARPAAAALRGHLQVRGRRGPADGARRRDRGRGPGVERADPRDRPPTPRRVQRRARADHDRRRRRPRHHHLRAGRTIAGTLAGPAVPWTSDAGKPLRVQLALHKGRLVQTFTAEDGGRRNVFTLDEAGDRMTLSVTITSERLTNPIKYALSYRRG